MRTRAERRWFRHVKGWRRLNEDRQQHGADRSCACWTVPGTLEFGRVFARFADYPKACRCYMCGNPRRRYGLVNCGSPLTLQELRAYGGRLSRSTRRLSLGEV